MFQKVESWPLERRKLRLEIEKLKREESEHRERVSDEYVNQLGHMARIEDEIVGLLSDNVHQLTDVEVSSHRERVNKQSQSDA